MGGHERATRATLHPHRGIAPRLEQVQLAGTRKCRQLTMSELGRTLDRLRERTPELERFVPPLFGGGVALVVGLWAIALGQPWTALWLVGSLLALVGTGWLGWGISRELTY